MSPLTHILLLAATALLPWTAVAQVGTSPDNLCGRQPDGKTFRCGDALPCCSKNGWCGANDDYCLKSTGCQDTFSVYCRANNTVSDDPTYPLCGPQKDGKTYDCHAKTPCCSRNGYCGSTDEFCLKPAGCKGEFSPGGCKVPVDKVTVSLDGTCAGALGYRCPAAAALKCCSGSGYCGNSTVHCAAAQGCQKDYGTCT